MTTKKKLIRINTNKIKKKNQIFYQIVNSQSRKIQTTFRLSIELVAALKIRASQEKRSLNNYVETILSEIVFDEKNYLLQDGKNKKRLIEGIKQYAEGKQEKLT